MVDSTQNAASPAEAPRELKSTDTSTVKPILEASKVERAEEPPKEKAEPAADAEVSDEDAGDETPEGDDAPPADAPKRKRRLSRWMRERVEEARQQAAQETEQRLLQQFQQQAPRQEEAPRLKTLEDFDYDQTAHTAYLVQEGIKQDRLQQQREAAQREQAQADEAFKAKIDEFETKVGAGAWEDILSSPVNTDPAFKPLVDLFRGDDHELAIAHHLATHLSEAKRINALPPIQKAREIAKLAEGFEGTAEVVETKPLPKKTTNAPPPPKTLSGAGRASVDINSPDLTPAQRIALWRKKTG